jgi:periplasmic protein TonB
MSRDDRQAAGSSSQENYEAAVLDFLDKEMAAVQPAQKKNAQSEELDALVSNLMKQVLTEAEEPKVSEKAAPTDMASLLDEFPPKPVEPPPPSTKSVEPPARPARALFETNVSAPKKQAEAKAKAKATPSTSTSTVTSMMASKKKMIIMGAASAALLAGIGASVYFFSGSSESASKATSPQPVASAPATATPAGQIQPAPAVTATPAPEVADISPAATSRRASSTQSAAPQKPPAVQQNKNQEMAQSKPTAAPAPVNQPSQATNNQQRPAIESQPTAPTQVAAPPPTPIAAAPSISDNDIAERRTAPPLPTTPPSIEKPAPVAQPVAQAPAQNQSPAQTQAPAPSLEVSKSLVQPVLISQASPVYPDLARRTRSSGSVVVNLQIDEKGKVVKATPVSGPAMFHAAAVAAAMKFRYKPASIGGASVSSQSRVTMDFNLNK